MPGNQSTSVSRNPQSPSSSTTTHARAPCQSDCSASSPGVGICTGTCSTGPPDTRWPAMSHSKASVTGILHDGAASQSVTWAEQRRVVQAQAFQGNVTVVGVDEAALPPQVRTAAWAIPRVDPFRSHVHRPSASLERPHPTITLPVVLKFKVRLALSLHVFGSFAT